MLKQYKGPQNNQGQVTIQEKETIGKKTTASKKAPNDKKVITPTPKIPKGRDKTPEKLLEKGGFTKKKVQFEDPTKEAKEVISVRSSANEVEELAVSTSDSCFKPKELMINQQPSVSTEEEVPMRPSLINSMAYREESFVNPNTEVTYIGANGNSKDQILQDASCEPQDKRKVLDHMARIEIDLVADEPCIVSFHYLYKDYLYDNNLMDPERAKYEEELEKKKLAKSLQSQTDKKDEVKGNEILLDNDEQSIEEENSNPFPNSGKSKYETLIKSMIARIEFNNCLAPIQEYGRHQTRVANKNKKNKNKNKTKVAVNGETVTNEDSAIDHGPKYDDNYYDLDDDFIDDDDLEINHDEMVTEMLYDGQSNIYSQTPGPNDSEGDADTLKNENEESKNKDDLQDPSDDEEDIDDIKQIERYNKLLKVYRVLPPDYVDNLIKEREISASEKLQQKEALRLSQLNTVGAVAQGQKLKQTNLLPLQSPIVPNSTEKTNKNVKKRDRDEAFGGQRTDDNSIDEILTSLRTRILNGETLNNFKREIQSLSEKIEKKDPTWSEKISQIVSYKLSNILQKPETEMLYMLQRTSLLEKRKKKKMELTKLLDMVKGKVEFDLKNQNKKNDSDFVDLEQLDPLTARFNLTDELRNLIPNVVNLIEEYVQTNKDYVNIKTLEEKSKAKKQRGELNLKLENVEFGEELEKSISQSLSGIPEALRDKVKAKIGPTFEKKQSQDNIQPQTVASPLIIYESIQTQQVVNSVEQPNQNLSFVKQELLPTSINANMPKKGSYWNKIVQYHDSYIVKNALLDLDNVALSKEYDFYRSIAPKSSDKPAREQFMHQLHTLFDSADKNHDGKIYRKDFETLMMGYFELKNIKTTKENFDKYFDALDQNHDHCISWKEFVEFMDGVIENDFLPMIAEEMQTRGLL